MTDRDHTETTTALDNAAPVEKTGHVEAQAFALSTASSQTGGLLKSKRSIDEFCITQIRTLAMDAVQQAQSGHLGTPMALAPVIYTLWQRFLSFHPDDQQITLVRENAA